jgi:hypothetical protein
MWEIKLKDGSVQWINERIIMKISQNEDGTFTLEHFNNSKIIIKGFSKL